MLSNVFFQAKGAMALANGIKINRSLRSLNLKWTWPQSWAISQFLCGGWWGAIRVYILILPLLICISDVMGCSRCPQQFKECQSMPEHARACQSILGNAELLDVFRALMRMMRGAGMQSAKIRVACKLSAMFWSAPSLQPTVQWCSVN